MGPSLLLYKFAGLQAIPKPYKNALIHMQPPTKPTKAPQDLENKTLNNPKPLTKKSQNL